MSRDMIEGTSIPIISRRMVEVGYINPHRAFKVKHGSLERLLRKRMSGHSGVVRTDTCQHLGEPAEEGRKRGTYAFEQLLRKPLSKSVELAVTIGKAKKLVDENRPRGRLAGHMKEYKLVGCQA